MTFSKLYKDLNEDLQNFNKVKNYFLIRIDLQIKRINEKIKISYKTLVITFDEITLYISKRRNLPKIDNPFKIIYGHFYDDENYIKYKDVVNDEIKDKVYLSNFDNIYKNKINQPIKYNSYEVIKNLLEKIFETYKIENDLNIQDENINMALDYKYDKSQELVIINEKFKTQFSETNNTLTIIN